jgi:RNA polymerase sigma factor (sigma-70 family)
MASRRIEVAATPELPDDQLTSRAIEGDQEAFEELYRRHAEAAWRVGYVVTGSAHDASDAVSEAFSRVFLALPAGRFPTGAPFRPYLLRAVRNAAIDGRRRVGRLELTSAELADSSAAGSMLAGDPAGVVVGALDSSLVATAFRKLPERWRSVLWLTEVEGLPPREVAELLGLSANGTAQLAVRARARLRAQFLQAHLRSKVERGCQFTVDHLGAYVGGALSARDTAKVDQHLAGCDVCRARQRELEDVGSTLRRIALPLPIGLGALAAARWKASLLAATEAAHRGWRGIAGLARAARPLALAAGVTLALGIIGTQVVHKDENTHLSAPSRQGPQQTSQSPTVVQGFVPPPVPLAAIETATDAAAAEVARAELPAGPATTNPTQPASGPSTTPAPSPTPAPAPPAAVPAVQVSLRSGTTAGAAIGVGSGGCTGVDVAGNVIGCAPPPSAKLLTVNLGGSLLGNTTVAL